MLKTWNFLSIVCTVAFFTDRFTATDLPREYLLQSQSFIYSAHDYSTTSVFFMCSVDRASWYIRTIRTNRVHCFLSIYFSKPLHVSSSLTAHHQEVLHCIYSNCYMSGIYVDWLLEGSEWNSIPILPTASQHKRMIYHVHRLLYIQSSTSWWWAVSLLETCRG
jgi:hypothetical protein